MTTRKQLPPLDEQQVVLGQNPHTFAALGEMLRRHDGTFRVPHPLGEEQLVITHPDEVHHVLHAHHKKYAKGRTFANMKLLMGNGLIVQEGEFWRQQRKMIQPLFHERVLSRTTRTVQEKTTELLSAWTHKAKLGRRIDVSHDVAKTVLDTLLEALFSEDRGHLRDRDGRSHFDLLVDQSARSISLVPRFRALLGKVDEIVRLRERQERFPPDLLSMLMMARDRSGNPMPLAQLRDEVATLIVAGHETTAAVLTWGWHELSLHPEIADKLRAEMSAPRPSEGSAPGRHAPPYLKMLVLELLRLYPPVWIEDRVALEEDEIGDYQVPAGAEIFIPFYFIQRDPRFFQDPNTLRPERFADYPLDRRYAVANASSGSPGDTEEAEETASAEPVSRMSAFMAFSLGPRRCIGDQFALLTAHIHLGTIARELKLRHPGETSVTYDTGINLRPRGPVWMLPTLD